MQNELISYFLYIKPFLLVIAVIALSRYFFYLLVAPFYTLKEILRQKRLSKFSIGYYPLISIIVPAFNEEVGILHTLESILASTYHNVEVIVINDGSTDQTEEVVKRFIYQNGKRLNVRYYSQENLGKAVALNVGIRSSCGEIILTIDSDSVLHPDALTNLVKYYQDPNISGVVGRVVVGNTQSFLGLVQAIEYSIVFYVKKIYALLDSEYVFGGACASFRRGVFDVIGLYNTNNKTEDIDITLRMRKAGFSCTYGEDVICYTEGAATFAGLFRQRIRWNYGRILSFIHHRELFFSLNRSHNKFLSWFVLPMDIISLLQSISDVLILPLVLVYTVVSGDVIPLLYTSLVLFFFYAMVVLFDTDRLTIKRVLSVPLVVLLVVIVYIEGMTVILSIFKLLRRQDITWQQWKREGVKVDILKLSKKDK